jgi:hypothetical protein
MLIISFLTKLWIKLKFKRFAKAEDYEKQLKNIPGFDWDAKRSNLVTLTEARVAWLATRVSVRKHRSLFFRTINVSKFSKLFDKKRVNSRFFELHFWLSGGFQISSGVCLIENDLKKNRRLSNTRMRLESDRHR